MLSVVDGMNLLDVFVGLANRGALATLFLGQRACATGAYGRVGGDRVAVLVAVLGEVTIIGYF